MDELKNYLNYLEQLNFIDKSEVLEEVSKEAIANEVPIISDDGLKYLLQLLKMNNAKTIVELGTAVGYSASSIVTAINGAHVYTIERNKDMYDKAQETFKKCGVNNKVTSFFDDALTFDTNKLPKQIDVLFVDAAKSQYQKFIEKYEHLVKPGGLVICDNILFHGMVISEYIKNRNTRQLVNKLKKFNQWFYENKNYETVFHSIGDGMAVALKLK